MPDRELITPTIANQVLHHFGAGGYEPGSFTRDLITLITRADLENRAALRAGFPGYTQAVVTAQYTPNGIAYLRAIAAKEGEVSKS